MKYEPNPKHTKPWQPGRKGSLCTKKQQAQAQALLDGSTLDGKHRYATDGSQAFAAESHAPDRWHGWPVGWAEVPEAIRRQWIRDRLIQRSTLRKNWPGGRNRKV